MTKKEIINKQVLERLSELARIKLNQEKEEKLLEDLRKILEHFEELEKIGVENIESMAGGADLKNVFREDELGVKCQVSNVKLTDAFPEKEGGYLKVPEVFE